MHRFFHPNSIKNRSLSLYLLFACPFIPYKKGFHALKNLMTKQIRLLTVKCIILEELNTRIFIRLVKICLAVLVKLSFELNQIRPMDIKEKPCPSPDDRDFQQNQVLFYQLAHLNFLLVSVVLSYLFCNRKS